MSSTRYLPCVPSDISTRYTLLHTEIGRGVGGIVHTCVDRLTDERLACKSIPKESCFHPIEAASIRAEVEALQELAGLPHIVYVRDVYESEDCVHVVQELCDAGDLFSEVLSTRGYGLKETEARYYFKQLVEGVAACHEHGWLHRDLKLENIMLTSKLSSHELCRNADTKPQLKKCNQRQIRGARKHVPQTPSVPIDQNPQEFSKQVTIIDFSVALRLAKEEKISGPAGSLYYMAPEVLLCKPYDQKADMWSLGVVLYSMLSASFPFCADASEDLEETIVGASVNFSEGPWVSLSAEALNIVSRLLDKNPSRRPSAKELMKHPWFAPSAACVEGGSSGEGCRGLHLEESRNEQKGVTSQESPVRRPSEAEETNSRRFKSFEQEKEAAAIAQQKLIARRRRKGALSSGKAKVNPVLEMRADHPAQDTVQGALLSREVEATRNRDSHCHSEYAKARSGPSKLSWLLRPRQLRMAA
eukprot:TRINITY_DN212_c0_g1_i1.p1 TRINITY_DN212_c0_g1~~TRINITY_DN212_c0_g1_i1.p1  ORF type:complete len:473 (-),score=38.96 TRINITY_DN212_c0_g1_i1:1150-2568(-)